MNTIYLGYTFEVNPRDPATEILIAELGYAGFESFVENEKGVVAYIQKNDWSKEILSDIHILRSEEFEIKHSVEEIEQTNWNSEWEKNFEPIDVDGIVSVRAPFHSNPGLKYDIVIEPKMSFGTGHHETTHMMLQHLNEMDLEHKKVLDMGCGTGILAIFSEMKGAGTIDAIDIDNWCYENSIENVKRNNCKKISVFEGGANLLVNQQYDIIIANINLNILLQDITAYINRLNKKGELLLSGFYESDIPTIDEAVTALGLTYISKKKRNNWVALKYLK